MHVLVSDTSVLVELERGSLLEASFRLPFRFAVPDLRFPFLIASPLRSRKPAPGSC